MIHFTFILEDLAITATLCQIETDDGLSHVMNIHASDMMTGKSGVAIWTQDQWRAVMFLIADSALDILDTTTINNLYAIAEPAVNMLPLECRPIS